MSEERYRAREAAWWQENGVTPTERWVDLADSAVSGGSRTRLRLLEIGSGPPLLFLHGGPNAGSAFAPLTRELSGFRCILLDRPGCGLSPPIDYSGAPVERTMTELLVATLDALELDRVDLIATSFGGACAFWLARVHPSRVSSMVQLGCPAFIPAMRASFFLRLLATPGLGCLAARAPMNRRAVLGMYESMGCSPPSPAFVAWYLSLANDTTTMTSERELIKHAFTWRGMRPEIVFDDETLTSLPTRTLFYFGTRDPFCAARDIHALAGSMKDASVHVAEAGHLPWLDDVHGAAARVQEIVARA